MKQHRYKYAYVVKWFYNERGERLTDSYVVNALSLQGAVMQIKKRICKSCDIYKVYRLVEEG